MPQFKLTKISDLRDSLVSKIEKIDCLEAQITYAEKVVEAVEETSETRPGQRLAYIESTTEEYRAKYPKKGA